MALPQHSAGRNPGKGYNPSLNTEVPLPSKGCISDPDGDCRGFLCALTDLPSTLHTPSMCVCVCQGRAACRFAYYPSCICGLNKSLSNGTLFKNNTCHLLDSHLGLASHHRMAVL
ncbi:hypothetical protein ACRRTK_008760 [Alexandromys fortis]